MNKQVFFLKKFFGEVFEQKDIKRQPMHVKWIFEKFFFFKKKQQEGEIVVVQRKLKKVK